MAVADKYYIELIRILYAAMSVFNKQKNAEYKNNIATQIFVIKLYNYKKFHQVQMH